VTRAAALVALLGLGGCGAIPTAALTIGGSILVDVFDVGGDVAKMVGAAPRSCPVVAVPK
jgi:hypothetical protein